MTKGETAWRAQWWHRQWRTVSEELGYHSPGFCLDVTKVFVGAKGNKYMSDRCAGCHQGIAAWKSLTREQKGHFVKVAEVVKSLDCDLAWDRARQVIDEKRRRARKGYRSPYKSCGLHPARATGRG